MSILSLPYEVIVGILALAGSVDLRTLANAAQTCKALHCLVYQDQVVWREIHLLKYDDPRTACAFLRPRTEYDWKQRVIDRDYVTTSLRSYRSTDALLRYIEWALRFPEDVQHVPRVLKTVLDLYLDLPALVPRVRSRNVDILAAIVKSRIFDFMCVHGGCPGVSEQLEATLLHLNKLSGEHAGLWLDFLDYHQGAYADKDVLPKDEVYWAGMAVDMSFVAHKLMGKKALKNEKQIDSRLVRRAISGGIDSVRGFGILGLQRPAHLGKDAVWDWAHVRGEWYEIQTLEKIARVGPHAVAAITRPLWEVPDSFNISPTTTTAKLKAYEAFGMRDAPLPPVYFSGTSQVSKDGRHRAKSIFGLVHLTNDDPPQLRWTAAIINRARRDRSIIFQGVQVGGPGAKKGVFGAFHYWNCEGDNDEPPVVDFHAGSDGMVWLFKINQEEQVG